MAELHSREKWEQLSDEEIRRYLAKFGGAVSMGSRSSRRVKKLRFLREIQARRERTARLLDPDRIHWPTSGGALSSAGMALTYR